MDIPYGTIFYHDAAINAVNEKVNEHEDRIKAIEDALHLIGIAIEHFQATAKEMRDEH